MIPADMARRTGANGCRGILWGLALSVPLWGAIVGVAWLVSR